MANPTDERSAQKLKLAEIGEKYKSNIAQMSSRDLLDEFEKRALMASYGYQDPITALMLKEAKLELLRRTKGYEPVKALPVVGQQAEPKRQSLFS